MDDSIIGNVRGELFTSKMLYLYSYTNDKFEELVQNINYYMDEKNHEKIDNLHHLKNFFNIYTKYLEIKNNDKEIAEALYVTCLWYIHQYIYPPKCQITTVDEKGKEYILYGSIADYLIKKYMIVSANGVSYIFIGNMYYVDNGRIEKDINKMLKDVGYSETHKIEPIIKEIVRRIRGETMKFKSYPFNAKSRYLVPVKNGVVIRRKLNILLPQSPVWGFTYSLPIIYDPKKSANNVLKFISDIVERENRELLLQIPAHALLQNEGLQLSYLLTGGGANGKSTYINLITALIGPENITAVGLQELLEDRFKIAELQGKLMNMYADLVKTSLKTTGKFKILTGGDEITVERKYAHPFKMTNKAVLVFSANELPDVDDGTYAFWRRWAVIPFPKTFDNDPTFQKNLITSDNLSGLLNVVLIEMDKIEERNGLVRSNKVEEIMTMWKQRSNSAYAFVKETIVKDVGAFIPKDIIWNEYLRWCEEVDLSPVTKIKFKSEFDKIGAEDMLIQQDKRRIRVFKGVRRHTDKPSDVCNMTNDVNNEQKTKNANILEQTDD